VTPIIPKEHGGSERDWRHLGRPPPLATAEREHTEDESKGGHQELGGRRDAGGGSVAGLLRLVGRRDPAADARTPRSGFAFFRQANPTSTTKPILGQGCRLAFL